MKLLGKMLPSVVVAVMLIAAAAQAQTKIVAGPMVGHVSSTSARIWMQLNTTEEVWVKLVDRISNREVSSVRIDVEGPAPFILDAPISGLSPNRSYRLEVLFDNKPVNLPEPPVIIRTAPPVGEPEPFVLAYGSGISPAANPKIPAFKAMDALRPRALLLLGNCGYLPGDLKDWPQRARDAVRLTNQFQMNVRTTPDLQPLLRTTAVYGMWGEHDFGTTAADADFVFAAESRTSFMRYWANPDYGTPEVPGVFYTFNVGDADFFVLDDRTYRHAPVAPAAAPATGPALAAEEGLLIAPPVEAAVFGAGQLAWLKKQLRQSQASFKVIAAGSPLLTDDAAAGGGGWATAAGERAEFLKWLRQEQITGVLMISGGTRLGELTTRPGAQGDAGGYPLYDLTTGPMGVDVADEATQRRANPLREGPLVNIPNFGTLEFGGPRAKRFVNMRLRDVEGKVRLEKTVFAAELAGK